MDRVKQAIVRIRDSTGRIVGAGFLVASDIVLTCWHVVGEKREVMLDFPFSIAAGQRITATMIHGNREQDVAVLQVEGKLPPGTSPIRLAVPKETWGHPFRAFGFPQGHPDGVWAGGVLRGPNARGWLQIETGETGYRVQPGFSGTPVWDDVVEGVVGMVVAADRDPTTRAAFVIPAAMLREVWPVVERRSPKPDIAEVPPNSRIKEKEVPPATRGVVIHGNVVNSVIITGDGNVHGAIPAASPPPPPVYARTPTTATRICPICHLESPAGARRCRNCGYEFTD